MLLRLRQWLNRPSKKSLIRQRSAKLVEQLSDELARIQLLDVRRMEKLHLISEEIAKAEQDLIVEFKLTRPEAHDAILEGMLDADVKTSLG